MEVFQLYPEQVWVPCEQVIAWATDLRTDQVSTEMWKREGEKFDGDDDVWDRLVDETLATLPPLDLDDALNLLSDTGDHTFSTQTR